MRIGYFTIGLVLAICGCLASAQGTTGHRVARKVADLPQRQGVSSTGIAFSPSGEEVAVEGEPGVIEIWDWHAARVEVSLKKPQGALGFLVMDPLAYSPDGTLLAACDSSAAGNVLVRVWSTHSWQVATDIADSRSAAGCGAAALGLRGGRGGDAFGVSGRGSVFRALPGAHRLLAVKR